MQNDRTSSMCICTSVSSSHLRSTVGSWIPLNHPALPQPQEKRNREVEEQKKASSSKLFEDGPKAQPRLSDFPSLAEGERLMQRNEGK